MYSAVKDMSEGEALQIEKARRLDIEEKIYFEIIRKNKRINFSCCSCGRTSMNQDQDKIKKLKLFGEKVELFFR